MACSRPCGLSLPVSLARFACRWHGLTRCLLLARFCHPPAFCSKSTGGGGFCRGLLRLFAVLMLASSPSWGCSPLLTQPLSTDSPFSVLHIQTDYLPWQPAANAQPRKPASLSLCSLPTARGFIPNAVCPLFLPSIISACSVHWKTLLVLGYLAISTEKNGRREKSSIPQVHHLGAVSQLFQFH